MNLFKLLLVAVAGIILVSFYKLQNSSKPISGAPPYGIAESEVPDLSPYAMYANWIRPDGPAKVGIQVGHWNRDEVPEELENLKNNTGAAGGGVTETQVNMKIAKHISELLRTEGVNVEVLPVTVPQRYWADVFISIHADGSKDFTKSGFKFAGPWRDITGKSEKLVKILENNYQSDSGMEKDENITRNMRGYYAFSWWRYLHSIHPMTVGVIAETGFLTNSNDREFIVNSSDKAAESIADSILIYLADEDLLR